MIDVSCNMQLATLFSEICYDVETNTKLDHHSILVGKKTLTCMNCGKILLEYKKKSDFEKLMKCFEMGITSEIKSEPK